MAHGQRGDEENFFDVLIDRLIIDVKNDFEASLKREEADFRDQTPSVVAARDSIFDEPAKKRAPQFDDLLAKMIGFRSRISTPSAANSRAQYQLNSPRKFASSEIALGTATASRTKAKPQFESSDAQVAYTLILKSGAQFFAEDVIEEEITREALKRERRRVLLTLHPDRVPESDRGRAHEQFLSAAEAFSRLAAAMTSRRAA